MLKYSLAAVGMLAALPAWAAVDVGTLSAVGDSITTPLAFDKTVLNTALDTPGGLTFTIAPGLSGPVKLEILQSTANVKVVAAAIGSGFGISESLPLSIVSQSLGAGTHPFAIGAVTAGASQGAVISRLTLTPAPATLLLLGTALAGMGMAAWRRHPDA